MPFTQQETTEDANADMPMHSPFNHYKCENLISLRITRCFTMKFKKSHGKVLPKGFILLTRFFPSFFLPGWGHILRVQDIALIEIHCLHAPDLSSIGIQTPLPTEGFWQIPKKKTVSFDKGCRNFERKLKKILPQEMRYNSDISKRRGSCWLGLKSPGDFNCRTTK